MVQLGLKDYVGPLISVLAAVLSVVCFWLSFKLSRRMADRSLNLEAQKMLLEINRQLIADPWLWSIYDEHAVRTDADFGPKCAESALFHAKLEAFAYLCLNAFEVILAEAPKPARRGHRNESNIWADFFRDSVARSSVVRSILERSDASRIWSPILIECYQEWRSSTRPRSPGALAPT